MLYSIFCEEWSHAWRADDIDLKMSYIIGIQNDLYLLLCMRPFLRSHPHTQQTLILIHLVPMEIFKLIFRLTLETQLNTLQCDQIVRTGREMFLNA